MDQFDCRRRLQSKIQPMLVSIFLTCACHSFAFAESHLLGFNWGTKSGVEESIHSAEMDSKKTERGYLIGPAYWKSLAAAQFDADHAAGDGLYFSSHLFNSSRFGPSLLITEIVSSTDNLDRVVVEMTESKVERTPTKSLPPVVRYRGTWHVIKRLPFESESNQLRIFVRKPTEQDAEKIFFENDLHSDLAKALVYLREIVLRGVKDENKSTRRFMNKLKELLLKNSLSSYRYPSNFSAEETLNFTNRLSELLAALKNANNGVDVFGLNLKNLIYRSLLAESARLPSEVKTVLFLNGPELSIEITKGKIISTVIQELPGTKSIYKFLNLRRHLLSHGRAIYDDETFERIKNLPLPDERIQDAKFFDLSLLHDVPSSVLTEYLERWQGKAVYQHDLDNLRTLEKRLSSHWARGSSNNFCHSLFVSP